MDKQVGFHEICIRNNIEPIRESENQVVLICPKIPGKIVQDVVASLFPPDYNYRWEENLRVSTVEGLMRLFKHAGGELEFEMNRTEHSAEFRVVGESPYLEEGAPIWSTMQDLLVRDQYLSRFKITLNGKVVLSYDRVIADEIASHGDGKYISKDDLLNLQIALGATQDVNDFINAL